MKTLFLTTFWVLYTGAMLAVAPVTFKFCPWVATQALENMEAQKTKLLQLQVLNASLLICPRDKESPCGAGVEGLVDGLPVIVTAAHVVDEIIGCDAGRKSGSMTIFDDGPYIFVRQDTDHGVVTRRARLAVFSPNSEAGLDLALFIPEVPSAFVLYPFDPLVTPTAGQEVYFSGYPWGMPLVERAVVAHPDTPVAHRWGKKCLVIQGRGWYGSSGSGVFAWTGRAFRLTGIIQCAADPGSHPAPPLGCRGASALEALFSCFLRECVK
jgi:hypothetical protein